MNGLSRRDEFSCKARATSSLPVPLSPVISTVVGVSATRSSTAYSSRMLELWHAQIRDDQIQVVLLEHAQCLLAIFRGVHVVAVALELGAEYTPEIRLIVDD